TSIPSFFPLSASSTMLPDSGESTVSPLRSGPPEPQLPVPLRIPAVSRGQAAPPARLLRPALTRCLPRPRIDLRRETRGRQRRPPRGRRRLPHPRAPCFPATPDEPPLARRVPLPSAGAFGRRSFEAAHRRRSRGLSV